MTLSGQSDRHNIPSPIWENVMDGIDAQTELDLTTDLTPDLTNDPGHPSAAAVTPGRVSWASGWFTPEHLRSLSSRYALIGVWVVMAATYALIMPNKFLGVSTAQAIFGSQSALLFLAVAGLCTFVVGEFDLSFASVMGLSATIIPVLSALHHVNLAHCPV